MQCRAGAVRFGAGAVQRAFQCSCRAVPHGAMQRGTVVLCSAMLVLCSSVRSSAVLQFAVPCCTVPVLCQCSASAVLSRCDAGAALCQGSTTAMRCRSVCCRYHAVLCGALHFCVMLVSCRCCASAVPCWCWCRASAAQVSFDAMPVLCVLSVAVQCCAVRVPFPPFDAMRVPCRAGAARCCSVLLGAVHCSALPCCSMRSAVPFDA